MENIIHIVIRSANHKGKNQNPTITIIIYSEK